MHYGPRFANTVELYYLIQYRYSRRPVIPLAHILLTQTRSEVVTLLFSRLLSFNLRSFGKKCPVDRRIPFCSAALFFLPT